MLLLTVAAASPEGVEVLGHVEIINTGKHDAHPDRGNYDVTFKEDGRVIARAEIHNYDRTRGPWPLCAKALGSAIGSSSLEGRNAATRFRERCADLAADLLARDADPAPRLRGGRGKGRGRGAERA